MVKYVLHYFDVQGRAESIRLAFLLAKVDFEEALIAFADWPAKKPTFATQEVPALEVDGKMICQSKAILRYLGREFGLYGKTSLEAAYIDQAIDTIEDLWSPVTPLFNGTPEENAANRKKYLAEAVPPIYANIERVLNLDVAGDFFVGKTITVADLFLGDRANSPITYYSLDFVNALAGNGIDSLEKFPKLAALKSRIGANPIIAKRVAGRHPDEY